MTIDRFGIPTIYRGIRFRSRLEAKWARFFDAVEWPWLYEPFDLRWYIPDFVLQFEAAPLLVEVKPASSLKELEDYRGKVERSGWERGILMVGSGPFLTRYAVSTDTHLGLLGDPWRSDALVTEESPRLWSWGMLFMCNLCRRHSINSDIHSYHCRRCGRSDGDHHIEPAELDAEALWAQVSNAAQWRSTSYRSTP